MMNNEIMKNIPDEVLELLPWYALGKLSAEDQAYFDEALSVYPSLKGLLKQELHIVETVSEDKTLLDVDLIGNQDERLKSVFNMIDAIETETQVQAQAPVESLSALDKLKDFLGLASGGRSQYVPIAGVGILVISVAVLTAFVTPIFTESSDFVPASTASQDDKLNNTPSDELKSEIFVGFNGSSSDLTKNDALKGKVFKVEDTDKKGFYKVVFTEEFNISEIKDTIDELTAQEDLIWFAGESF